MQHTTIDPSISHMIATARPLSGICIESSTSSPTISAICLPAHTMRTCGFDNGFVNQCDRGHSSIREKTYHGEISVSFGSTSLTV